MYLRCILFISNGQTIVFFPEGISSSRIKYTTFRHVLFNRYWLYLHFHFLPEILGETNVIFNTDHGFEKAFPQHVQLWDTVLTTYKIAFCTFQFSLK